MLFEPYNLNFIIPYLLDKYSTRIDIILIGYLLMSFSIDMFVLLIKKSTLFSICFLFLRICRGDGETRFCCFHQFLSNPLKVENKLKTSKQYFSSNKNISTENVN